MSNYEFKYDWKTGKYIKKNAVSNFNDKDDDSVENVQSRINSSRYGQRWYGDANRRSSWR